jgi:hypothetical protein
MIFRATYLAIPLLAAGLSLGMAQGGSQTQPVDPTAQSPSTPVQSTPTTFPEPAQTQGPGNSSSTPKTDASSKGTLFTGSIVRQKSALVLKSANSIFKLDDQSQAKEYEGKTVKVTGSLDKGGKKIHVEKIEPSDSM